MKTLSGVIYGNLPRKSNQRRLVHHNGKLRFIKSQKALDYEKSFIAQALYQGSDKTITKPCELTAIIYYDSKRPDLSDELLCDLLEKVNVIENDRLIFKKILEKRIDRKNPRVEWVIREIE